MIKLAIARVEKTGCLMLGQYGSCRPLMLSGAEHVVPHLGFIAWFQEIRILHKYGAG